MSVRVADAYGAQKEFVGDVSHELRTPITSIRGFSEALLDGTIGEGPARERALQAIHDEAGRIAELTRTLLTLAELDAGDAAARGVPVDTAQLAEALSERFESRAAEEGRALEVGPLEGTPLADPARLLQALSILVENALDHTAEGTRVRVLARVRGDAWEASVDDAGAGVPSKDRDRVFGRFTRLDSSRAAGGGSGLGLAICRSGLNLNSTRPQRPRNRWGP
jgi:two-component system OmpR family sensor kinase